MTPVEGRMILPGTQGYAEKAPELLVRYEEQPFALIHRPIAHLMPRDGLVLDIGAGTGRDAAGFAAMGNRVIAVEPTAPLREGGRALHSSPLIDWIDDGLPELTAVRALGLSFDLVMMTAVWMHLDEAERRWAMPNVAALVRPGGIMSLTQRHGPTPKGRRMFEIGGEETIALAAEHGLAVVLHLDELPKNPRNLAAGVTWTRLAFVRE